VDADEFIRRFLLHSLPPGVQRIRHYGLFAGRTKKRNLTRCRELLAIPCESLLPTSAQIQAAVPPLPDACRQCPACLIGQMVRVARIAPLRQDSS
jgi:hypothetical protein